MYATPHPLRYNSVSIYFPPMRFEPSEVVTVDSRYPFQDLELSVHDFQKRDDRVTASESKQYASVPVRDAYLRAVTFLDRTSLLRLATVAKQPIDNAGVPVEATIVVKRRRFSTRSRDFYEECDVFTVFDADVAWVGTRDFRGKELDGFILKMMQRE
jgi:hypothetical protein